MSKLIEYPAFIKNLKEEIGKAQVKASLAVNQELIRLYWRIGKMILEKQEQEGWGQKSLKPFQKTFARSFQASRVFPEQISFT